MDVVILPPKEIRRSQAAAKCKTQKEIERTVSVGKQAVYCLALLFGECYFADSTRILMLDSKPSKGYISTRVS